MQIVVPDGSTVSDNLFSAGGTISPPAGFVNWAAVGGTPSGGWHITNAGRDRIEIPAGLACRQRSRQDSRSAWLHSQGEGTVQRRGFWPAFRTLRSRAWANALRIRQPSRERFLEPAANPLSHTTPNAGLGSGSDFPLFSFRSQCGSFVGDSSPQIAVLASGWVAALLAGQFFHETAAQVTKAKQLVSHPSTPWRLAAEALPQGTVRPLVP